MYFYIESKVLVISPDFVMADVELPVLFIFL